jgi:H/ACA ribonucleoprotein complex subunit 2
LLNIIRFVVIAADISPIDVLSHLPILCEFKNIPYMYVPSREAIGTACKTKRPTSCVFICQPEKKHEMKEKYTEAVDLVKSKNPYI